MFIEKHCAKLTESMPTKVNNSYRLLDICENLNLKGMRITPFSCHSKDLTFSQHWQQQVAIKNVPNWRFDLSPSTECMIKDLEICLTNTNSTFAGQNLHKQVGLQRYRTQASGTATVPYTSKWDCNGTVQEWLLNDMDRGGW